MTEVMNMRTWDPQDDSAEKMTREAKAMADAIRASLVADPRIASIEKLLFKHFYTGEPGDHESIKEAASELAKSRPTQNVETLIENLLQTSLDYETCDRSASKHLRKNLEEAKQAIRNALSPAVAQGPNLADALRNLLDRIDHHFGGVRPEHDWKEQADARAALAPGNPGAVEADQRELTSVERSGIERALFASSSPSPATQPQPDSKEGDERLKLYRDIFAEITAKAIPICDPASDDPERVRGYRLPVGPLHRAAGKLGFQLFDGERHLNEAIDEIARLKAALTARVDAPAAPPADAVREDK